MPTSSRTAKSIKNSSVALVFYFINLVLQFFSRKIFLDHLGAEVLGLNTTAQNLLGFLNIAELGIGAAVAYNLYKPIYEDNHQAINDIVSIQGWLYRRIACIVIAGACVLMCFFPLIFGKAGIPLWYAYGSFIALLISALLGYFVNYRQIVLSADQKEYKITYCVQGAKCVKVFLQMLAVWLMSNGYVWWMILEVVMAVITSIVLDRSIKKEYPWLSPVIKRGNELRNQYPEIITKTKQVFFHKIGGFVLSQTSPLVIYAYASLTLVAIYGNYMLIVTGIIALMNALFNGLNAGIGNLVAEGNKEKIKAVFWKITVFRMWLASVICFGMYTLGHPFIKLWVGEEYVMSQSAYMVLIAITFIQLTRTNDAFLSAYGLFQDIWAPVMEASLNLGLSILLGYYFGLTGILSGVLISLIVIVNSWKPYFLYKKGFLENIMEYVIRYSNLLGIFLASCWISNLIGGKYVNPYILDSYFSWFLYGANSIGIYILISTIILFLNAYLKAFIRKLYRLFIFQ